MKLTAGGIKGPLLPSELQYLQILPLLGFWRSHWQTLVLGLVVFISAFGLFFSALVWLILDATIWTAQLIV
jgi:hypothetical protein